MIDTAPSFGIYIHWPYCTRICPYCDFNVYKAGKSQSGGDDLIKAIAADLAYWRALSGPRIVDSVHFGGGTPSLMSAQDIGVLLEKIDALWGLPDTAQIALEANPNDADLEKWRGWRAAGLTRVSLGVQSFDDRVLKFLGRDHDSGQAQRALELAGTLFPHVSADLIFGHRGQSLTDWAGDLERALSSGAGHISAYQLTVEAGTAFDRARARGEAPAVDADSSADLYELARDTLTANGFEPYEVSNFAKPGQRSVHNMIYWLGGDYVGVGPGAHGRLSTDKGRLATVAIARPQDYMQGVSRNHHGLCDQDTLTPDDHGAEYVMMGLRILEGISLSQYKAITGQDLNIVELGNLTQQGLIRAISPDRVATTPAGRLLLDAICRLLLTSSG